jgi:hypothetical protein
MQETFNMMVLEHFEYLVSQYDFRVDKNWQRDPDFRLEGVVEYASPTTLVSVVGGLLDVEVSIGRVGDDRKCSVPTGLVHEFLSITPEEREIICSHDPRRKKESRLLIASKQLQYEKHEFANGDEETEYRVIDHARWLRQYADPFLRGDFSLWLALHEYRLAKMIGEVRQSWKREVSRRDVGMIGTTAGRKLIYVKEHMFQSDVDYLARLKSER